MTDETPTRDALIDVISTAIYPYTFGEQILDRAHGLADAILTSDVLDRVRADERERCAQIVEGAEVQPKRANVIIGGFELRQGLAAAIRAEMGGTR